MTNSELTRDKKTAQFAPNDSLLPCPFCGGKASTEEVKMMPDISNYSVGCTTEDCMGYQSTTTFARRYDAAQAWNKRASTIHTADERFTDKDLKRLTEWFNGLDDTMPEYLEKGDTALKEKIVKCIVDNNDAAPTDTYEREGWDK